MLTRCSFVKSTPFVFLFCTCILVQMRCDIIGPAAAAKRFTAPSSSPTGSGKNSSCSLGFFYIADASMNSISC